MDDLIRQALLGDKQAQEECTRQGIVLPCPFCKGKARTSFKDSRFIEQNMIGDKKLVYRVQVICNKCRGRGKPVFTKPLINPNPHITKWGNRYHAESDVCKEETGRFLPYVTVAISEWNTRRAPPIGRCGECKHLDDTGSKPVCWHTGFPLKSVNDFCSYFEHKGV